MSAAALEPGRERTLLWLLTFTQFTVIMDFMVMMPPAPQLMNAFAVDPAAISKVYAWIGGQFLTSDSAGRIGNYGVNGWLAAMLALAASFRVLRRRAPEAVAAVA